MVLGGVGLRMGLHIDRLNDLRSRRAAASRSCPPPQAATARRAPAAEKKKLAWLLIGDRDTV
jgi:hypothetical protein